MITEDYVSFEVAKLLKEKGFDESCGQIYDGEGNLNINNCGYINEESPDEYFHSLAPTHQLAMKWLREEHNIFIVIEPHMYDYINEKNSSYVTSLWQGDNYYENITSKDYPTYEEAVEAALKYSLENLI
jgi:hypothetical protein